MEIQEIQNTLDELEIELKKVLVDASPSTAFVLRAQNLMIKNLIPMILDLRQQNEAMQKQNETLISTIKDLQETIKELQCKLGKDSHNSSKPSSSNPFKKQKSLREKTGRKQGGQKGHSGSHMRIPHEPDNVVLHVPEKCKTCPFITQCVQSKNAFSGGERRYEVNVEVNTIVTEHQVLEVKECNCGCLKGTKGEFPIGLKAYVQYGNSFAILATMLSTYGAVSYKRIATMIRNITGVSLSEGTLTSMVERCSKKIDGALHILVPKQSNFPRLL